MAFITDRLRQDHRAIEEHLDSLEAAILAREEIPGRMARVEEAIHAHARREAPFWTCLRRHAPELAAKIENQHEQAREAAGYFQEANPADQLQLARRYHAIVQHNLIEEERDVFPLADRCFTPHEQDELIAAQRDHRIDT